MAVAHRIAEFDTVELTEPVDDAPAGARGGVLELHPDDTAMVEIHSPRPETSPLPLWIPDRLKERLAASLDARVGAHLLFAVVRVLSAL